MSGFQDNLKMREPLVIIGGVRMSARTTMPGLAMPAEVGGDHNLVIRASNP